MSAMVECSDAPAYARRVAEMLGVARSFRRGMGSAVAVHEVLHAGLPRRALLRAMHSGGIPVPELLPVFGISTRTYMRLKTEPDKLLDAEQSGRVWQFAELLAKAEDVFGSNERAVELDAQARDGARKPPAD